MAAASNDEFHLIIPETTESVQVKLGSELTVPCHLSPETSAVNMEIRWFKETDCLCDYKNRQMTVVGGYENKVSLLTGELNRGNVSLTLQGFTESDLGDYVCQVTSGERRVEITVRVKEAEKDKLLETPAKEDTGKRSMFKLTSITLGALAGAIITSVAGAAAVGAAAVATGLVGAVGGAAVGAAVGKAAVGAAVGKVAVGAAVGAGAAVGRAAVGAGGPAAGAEQPLQFAEAVDHRNITFLKVDTIKTSDLMTGNYSIMVTINSGRGNLSSYKMYLQNKYKNIGSYMKKTKIQTL
nr:butyrophilin subfamily 3 member A3-like [Misgurnus anguillicaudatus]